MNFTVETLRDLASKLKSGDPHAWSRLQEHLQPGLVHVFRRALRTGKDEALKSWIGRALPAVRTQAGEDPSTMLAWMLCNGIAGRSHPDQRAGVVAAAETVVEGEGGRGRGPLH